MDIDGCRDPILGRDFKRFFRDFLAAADVLGRLRTLLHGGPCTTTSRAQLIDFSKYKFSQILMPHQKAAVSGGQWTSQLLSHAANLSHPSRNVNACLLLGYSATTLVDEIERPPSNRGRVRT